MNQWDRDNLQFILNADEETFAQFLLDSSDDDIEYALELIQRAKTELSVQELELQENKAEEQDMDLSAAQSVLARFRL